MKILDQNPKEYFDKIVDAKKEDRSWVLSVLLIFLAVAFGVTCFFVFRATAEKAESRAVKAESQLEAQRLINLNDAKDCPQLIRHAEIAVNNAWQAKYNILEEKYLSEQKEFLSKYEQLHKRSVTLRSEQQRINKIVKE